MNHTVAVALKTGPVRMLFLTMLPPLALAAFDGVGDQHFLFHLFNVAAIDQTLISLKRCCCVQTDRFTCHYFSKFKHGCLIPESFILISTSVALDQILTCYGFMADRTLLHEEIT